MNTAEFTNEAAPRVAQLPLPEAPGPRGVLGFLRVMKHVTGDIVPYLAKMMDRYSNASMIPVRLTDVGRPMYLILHPAHIKTVLTTPEVYARILDLPITRTMERALGRSVVTAPTLEWRPMRKRTLRYFGREQLRHYGSVVVDVLEKRALPVFERAASQGSSVDLFDEMLNIGSLAAFMSFLGDGIDDPPREVYRALNELFCYVRRNGFALLLPPMWLPTAENRQLRKHRKLVHDYLRSKLAASRDKETVLGDTIRAHTGADGVPDIKKILDEITSNLVGGSETTIVLMNWAVYYLIKNPEVEAKLAQELVSTLGERSPTVDDLRQLPYLMGVVNETLRLRSPAYLGGRAVIADTELGGYAIPKGAAVLFSQYITHRHPQVWKNPEAFIPERFAADSPEAPMNRRSEVTFFPFGGGETICVGSNFAINETALMLAVLLRRFRLSFADPMSIETLGLDRRVTLRPDKSIRVLVRRRDGEHPLN